MMSCRIKQESGPEWAEAVPEPLWFLQSNPCLSYPASMSMGLESKATCPKSERTLMTTGPVTSVFDPHVALAGSCASLGLSFPA